MQFTFHSPTELRIGCGQINSLPELVKSVGIRPLLVLDPIVMAATPPIQGAVASLKNAGLS